MLFRSDNKNKPPVDEKGQAYTLSTRTKSNDDDKTAVPRAWEKPKTEGKNYVERALEKITNQAEMLSQKAQSAALLQIDFETKGQLDECEGGN